MQRERIVVTGFSALTCIGLSVREMWEGLVHGRSGISPVENLPFSTPFEGAACQIKDFHDVELREFNRAAQLAICGVRDAITNAQLDELSFRRVPLLIGTTMSGFFAGALEPVSSQSETVTGAEFRVRAEPVRPKYQYCSELSEVVATYFKMTGIAMTIPTACSAGNYAIALGAEYICRNASSIVICGGADAFSPIAFAGFSKLKAMAKDVCRPFDLDRDGILVSEGSAFLVLESLSSARARGAHIYAELAGYGMSCDGYHITAPHPKGRGAKLAMERALERAGIGPEELDYICAHGTGTFANDRMEAEAIQGLLGNKADTVPVSSIKSSMGHAMGAASAIEAVACSLALEHQFIPPTLHCRNPDPEFSIDVVCERGRSRVLTYVLSNAFAFGGNNAAIILKRWDS